METQVQEKAVIQVQRTLDRLINKVGHTAKKRRMIIRAALAARILLRQENLTIDFRPESESMRADGLETIWQFLAHQFPTNRDLTEICGPTNKQRFAGLEDRARMMQRAFSALRKDLDKDWRKIPLLMVPRISSQKAIEVITINPTYPVNELQQTAGEIYRERLKDRFKVHTRSFIDKQVVIKGPDAVREAKDWLQSYITDVANQLRQPMLSLDFDDDDQDDIQATDE